MDKFYIEGKNCAWCDNHIWDDVNQNHKCIKKDAAKDLGDKCEKFKNSGRYQNGKV